MDYREDVPANIYVLGSFVVACTAKVTRLPTAGETLDAAAFVAEPGGKGFNFAVGLRRLGFTVEGVFGVGRDGLAVFARDAFRRAGLPERLIVAKDVATGCGVGFTDSAGENVIAVHAGANAAVSAGDIRDREEEIAGAAMVLAQLEIAPAAVAEAFRLARRHGRPTLLNPSPCRAEAAGLLALTSILVVNRTEADDLAAALDLGASGSDPELFARAAMERGPDLVVVTAGAAGAFALSRGGEERWQPAFPVEAVDTIGAGDAFTAGLAGALVEGRPLADAMRRAAGCGAMVACRLGVFDALPTAEALDAFLGRADG